MPVPSERPRLRKREIVLALALGALGAGGAGIMLSEMQSDASYERSTEAPAANREFKLEPFAKIATQGPQDVDVRFGDTFSVRAEGSPEALAKLDVIVENGRLTIRPAQGFHWTQWGLLEDVAFHVTLPRLESINLSGSGDIDVDRIETDKFDATVGGDGEINIGDLKAEQASLTVNGSGNLIVTGVTGNAQIHTAGDGEVQAGGLRSKTASIAVYGDGDVSLIVEDEAQVSVTGSGNVTVTGPGRCSVTRYGPGEVRCSGGGSVTNGD